MQELENKIALVVGAGTAGEEVGNGRATAITFAREGATVVCADLDVTLAETTAQMIREEGGNATAVQLDYTVEEQVEQVVADTVAEHGRIDVLDNNVGIASLGGVTDLDPTEWERVIRVNVTGAYLTMRHAIPHMVTAGGGSIVNISSVAGIRYGGVPYAAYYASKAALNHLSRTTALEFASRSVRVNTVLPGLIKTPMVANVDGITQAYDSEELDEMWSNRDRQVPMGHMGRPWDVANAALFLASDRSKYVTGIDLIVDGGLSVGVGKAG